MYFYHRKHDRAILYNYFNVFDSKLILLTSALLMSVSGDLVNQIFRSRDLWIFFFFFLLFLSLYLNPLPVVLKTEKREMNVKIDL